ncbi:hypothetical protein IW140_005906 [Coemansia sp. RSA 1813]|nr:hypothetical protein EV178_005895 [Coemansia sp. RSA 1646]KAJ1767683.1 hypothetical protein LPJ74_005248 [Coemansia sp. RSA 1843]KAJ2086240.1 hypothetical protein IW138_005833 [Coemansia sp. RSA 986]KAJ2214894.1 hypothetical protein EV179_002569 [Coemansia sp. RSA 487]KAJ2563944.1 hypothetical protein IW140_005906 [Coemansia sp. RSA 1813]
MGKKEKKTSNFRESASDKADTLDKELEELRALAPDSGATIKEQFDILSDAEQNRLLQKMVAENEADIQAFSAFLKLPTVTLLMLNLIFAYNYALSGLGSSRTTSNPMLPFIGYELRSKHPILATEISVVILQFALYLLSSRRWDMLVQYGIFGSFIACFGHVLTCRSNGVIELIWWLLPVLNLVVVCYAQFNMRRSKQAIENLSEHSSHKKDA